MSDWRGGLRKMQVELGEIVRYRLFPEQGGLCLNDSLGQSIRLSFTGAIHCVACDRLTKKSFNQGYCFPCLRKLAACDSCIVSPEKCHLAEGTCREPDWAETHCQVPHIVYLSNTSSVKVGITRETQIPTRWIDQGATQAKPIARVQTRHQSGLLEVLCAQQVGDRTAWQTMLKGDGEPQDLEAIRQKVMASCKEGIADLKLQYGESAFELLEDAHETEIKYPVLNWPEKVKAHNFDKQPVVEGTLMGIKGQYLMLDTGVLNIRKFGGYEVEIKVAA
ncbi:MAG: DUF2797 domain-containing protein [Luminiphilus sp.]|nr:DUF2797 domain-containing protein [Luminiphilus sp.]